VIAAAPDIALAIGNDRVFLPAVKESMSTFQSA